MTRPYRNFKTLFVKIYDNGSLASGVPQFIAQFRSEDQTVARYPVCYCLLNVAVAGPAI
jgi:hypothetical protein